ncbi:Lrp/AsnC family transcriptional regulator [Oxalobacteraceae bacterium OM1]|nr:Lrp/AsnC family transcriptional regulator [Oxalobacteraceae bacterium OM1]
MAREQLDPTDRRLVSMLASDAQLSVNQLAEKMMLSPPTIRSRMRALLQKGVLKIVGLLNLSERPELISAFVGINANARGSLDELAQKIAALPFVSSVSIVTGRYDLIVEILAAGDMDDLYRFTCELLPRVADAGVIERSESFVVMRSRNKWVHLPKGYWEDDGREDAAGAAPLAGPTN